MRNQTDKIIAYPKDEPFHMTVDKALAALLAAHKSDDLPRVYAMDDACVMIEAGPSGPVVRPVEKNRGGAAFFKGLPSRIMEFRTRTANGDRIASPPNDVVWSILAKPTGLPILEGVVDITTMRPDGSIIAMPGYDESLRLYYNPARKVPAVFDSPSSA
jgi:hypothetical protein